MPSIFYSLLAVIAASTEKELARQIKYLKVENEVLRAKLPKRLAITPKERQRLLKFGRKLGKALRAVVTIVSPETFLRWIREEKKDAKRSAMPAKRGRRRTPEQIRRLVLKIARETGWGYTRILGELKKLGVRKITRNTVKNILKEKGLDPGPKRGEGTWDEFIKQHAASLWQCDFLSRKVVTPKGLCDAFVLVFLNVQTRRAIVSPATLNPTADWVVAQTELFVTQARGEGLPVARLQRDRDAKYAKTFDQTLRKRRIQVIKGAYRSPNTQAYVERFIQTLQVECLDHFVIFGTKHFDVLTKEFLGHYHTERPHQGIGVDNDLLTRVKEKTPQHHSPVDDLPPLSQIRCRQRLGGLLKSYHRAA